MSPWNKIENPETEPCIYENSVQDRVGLMIQRVKEFIDDIETNDDPIRK